MKNLVQQLRDESDRQTQDLSDLLENAADYIEQLEIHICLLNKTVSKSWRKVFVDWLDTTHENASNIRRTT